ncbi:uncharacterized protein EDB91DRAFT_892972 [Suillus paluster]|uniref:uncharacterized protein n=1 Tax=Suillus paluster TaxID=48578 RepID=UPI001B87929E|nr:uncharacterized protein EDB91DRAFT_892972 [Suillus paluster]KAG1727259.1 hypothetical protein EDB91DRAFT_892972 [Suillus paluster]
MISPRTSRSSMSSNINPIPTMRRTSESSAHPSSASLSTPTTPSSIPSFRAIRNLLPFGHSKPSSPAQTPSQTKHPFHFASLRRSSDRKASISSIRDRQREHDNPPVISISRIDAEEFGVQKKSYDLTRAASASDSRLPSLSTPSQPPTLLVDELYAPLQPCPADLSTIIEADNSGISRYIPSPSPSPPTSPQPFFPSKVTCLSNSFFPPPSQATPEDPSASPKDSFPPTAIYSQTSRDPSPSASNLDLDISKLSAELHDALSPTNADGWLSAVVVEDADVAQPPFPPRGNGSDDRDTNSCLPRVPDPDATFDFSALDPDLAELLSPHRASSKDKGDSATEQLWDKSVSSGLSSAPYVGGSIPQTPAPRVHCAPSAEQSTTPLSLRSSSIEPLSREPITPLSPSIRSAAVPKPTTSLLPLSRPSLTVRRPPSHLPRLMRSVTSASPSIIACTPGTSVETAPKMQRRQPPSPLSAGQVTADTATRSSSDTVGLRASSHTGVPRPSVEANITPRSSSDAGISARAGSRNRHPTLQGHVSNVDVVPIRGATPSVPCITTTLVPTFTVPSSVSPSASTTTLTSSPSATAASANPGTPTSSSPPTTSTPHDSTHIRRRHHPHLFFSRKRSLSVDEPSSLSTHTERPGSSASNRRHGMGRFGLGLRNGVGVGSRVNLTPGENRLVSSPLTRSTVTSGPQTMEWLGPRTVKAFAAAGLFDGEREESGARFERERAGSVNRLEQEREGASSALSRYDRDREGATSVMSRFDRDRDRYDRDRDYSTIHRYASLRDHAPSRAAFSEAASTSSFGTRSACTATGWSPTFSSAPRTAFSGSTAPTSVSSGVGSGIGAGAGLVNPLGVNGTGPNGVLRTLQEKHCAETSALLSALADSQEACRKLREENGVLRERLRVLEAMVDTDREDVGLGRSVGFGVLDRDEEDASDKTHRFDQDFERFPRNHLASLHVSPSHQARTLTPVPRRPHLERSRSHLPQHARHHSVSAKASFDFTFQRSPSPLRSTQYMPPSPQKRQPQPSSSLSIQPPPSPQKKQVQKQRRASTSSSLFPAPPPEMSMLMLEDVGLSAAVSESPPSPGGPYSLGKKLGHKHSYSHSMIPRSHSFYASHQSHSNQSVTFTSFASTGTAAPSPSTATFSVTEAPGSPHSLKLRPEHELHLGDMASLSLYAMSDGEGEDEEGGWKDDV